MDSGSENDSAGDGRSADERRDRKNLRQIAKRRRAEKELRKREKALGGKREPRRLRRGRKKVAALTELGSRLGAELGDEAYAAALDEGAHLDGDAAVEHALRAL